MPVKTKFGNRQLTDQKREIMQAVLLLERLVHGSESFSASRRLAIRIATSIVTQKGSPVASQSAKVSRSLWMIDLLANWQRHVEEACDCR